MAVFLFRLIFLNRSNQSRILPFYVDFIKLT